MWTNFYWYSSCLTGSDTCCGVLRLVVVSSRVIDNFLHPPAHPEQVGVEAVLSVAVAALAPGHDADLVPAILGRVLHRRKEAGSRRTASCWSLEALQAHSLPSSQTVLRCRPHRRRLAGSPLVYNLQEQSVGLKETVNRRGTSGRNGINKNLREATGAPHQSGNGSGG